MIGARERTGFRDRSWPEDRRDLGDYVGDTRLAYTDVDGLDYCPRCGWPLACTEAAMSSKPPRATDQAVIRMRGLVAAAGLIAVHVTYDLVRPAVGLACNGFRPGAVCVCPECKGRHREPLPVAWPAHVQVEPRQVGWPAAGLWMTRMQYGTWLSSLHDEHDAEKCRQPLRRGCCGVMRPDGSPIHAGSAKAARARLERARWTHPDMLVRA